ncbi:hypothetical protein [Pseudoneobacillus sp. C159]
MVAVIGVILISILIVWKEVTPLKKQKRWREIWIFAIFQVVATTLLSLFVWNSELPTPLEVIRMVYQPFSDVLFSLLS